MLQQLRLIAARSFTNATSTAPLFCSSLQNRFKSNATTLDYSRYPQLKEDELEETFTRGSGPGGQAVNKTSNCVLLRHIPTNILIKCHKHRSASQNRVEARKLLLEKLDAQRNGEHAIAAQQAVLDGRKSAERKRRQTKSNEMKRSWQERESAESLEQPKGEKS